MSEATKFPSPEASTDDDDDIETTQEKKPARVTEKAKDLASSIFAAEKKSAEKEVVAEKSKSLFGNVMKVESTEPSPAETPLSATEQQIAEQLATEGEINLHEQLAEIAPDRDEAIVDEALEIAAEQSEIETATEEDGEAATEADTAEEVPTTPEIDVEEDEVPATPVQPTRTASSSSATGGNSGSGTGSGAGGSGGGSGGTGGGSGTGGTPPPPIPPVPPVGGPAPGVPRRRTFASTYNAYPTPATATNFNAMPNPATPTAAELRRSREEAEAAAFRRGRNRGLVAGLLVGGGVEHIRHKRREKRMERKFERERKEQEKKAENVRWDHVREAETAKVLSSVAEKQRSAEQLRQTTQMEALQRAQQQAEKKAAEEKPLTKAEQIELQRQQEQLELQQGHHIERSAWHNIEVDEHGRAVESGAIEYGHEYYKERAHETGPKQKQQLDEAAGEVAIVAAALAGSASTSGGATAEPERSVVSSAPQATRPAPETSALKKLTSPPTTPAGTIGWSIALVVILGVFIFVLL